MIFTVPQKEAPRMKSKKSLAVLMIGLLCLTAVLLPGCGLIIGLISPESPSAPLAFTNQHAISAGALHAIGIRKDGTVVVAFPENMDLDTSKFDVSGWKDIVSVGASGEVWAYNLLTAGLKKDGTVVCMDFSGGQTVDPEQTLKSWRQIQAIAVGFYHIVGLRQDGSVVVTGDNTYGQCNISDWTNIVAIAAGPMHTVGLMKDGTVVATGLNENGECLVSSWENIKAIAAGPRHTVGLRQDGTVVAIGSDEDGIGSSGDQQCNVSGWSDIIAVSAGAGLTIGLKKDGTVVCTDPDARVSEWTDMIEVTGFFSPIGLKKDGTVLGDDFGVSSWNNIGIPPGS